LLADAKNVFRGRVQTDNKQMLVKQNNARAERIKNGVGIGPDGSVVAGTTPLARLV